MLTLNYDSSPACQCAILVTLGVELSSGPRSTTEAFGTQTVQSRINFFRQRYLP